MNAKDCLVSLTYLVCTSIMPCDPRSYYSLITGSAATPYLIIIFLFLDEWYVLGEGR